MSSISFTQRWRRRAPRWRPVDDSGFDPERYDVIEIDEPAAAAFIAEHHYAPNLPSTTYRYGLRDCSTEGQPRLVGVATLGVPMSRGVLTGVFPSLEPYTETLDFNRLTLLDSVGSNGESWFCAQTFARAAERGLRGLVAFADPVERWRTGPHGPERIKPGHCGIVYQALNFQYLGRSTARTLTVLPDATVLTARAQAKVTGRESGAAGVIARLVGLGATAPDDDTDPRRWLRVALREVGSQRVRHPGNHRYALRIGRTRIERTRTVIGMAAGRYPKPDRLLPPTP